MDVHPFTISPTPANLYVTPTLGATLHKVRFVVDNRQGLTVVLGDVGMGKSSVLRMLFGEYAARPDARACFIPTPSFKSDFAFLKGICQEFNLPTRRSLYDQQRAMQEFLADQYEQERNVVVFIDEAQMLKGAKLEMLRTMLNFESDSHKLVQIVLAAQLELRDSLRDSSKRALRSRIVAASMLAPLTPDEMVDMLEYRCKRAGIRQPFTPDALTAIYKRASGTPRDVLSLCSVTYELAQSLGETTITPELFLEAVGKADVI